MIDWNLRGISKQIASGKGKTSKKKRPQTPRQSRPYQMRDKPITQKSRISTLAPETQSAPPQPITPESTHTASSVPTSPCLPSCAAASPSAAPQPACSPSCGPVRPRRAPEPTSPSPARSGTPATTTSVGWLARGASLSGLPVLRGASTVSALCLGPSRGEQRLMGCDLTPWSSHSTRERSCVGFGAWLSELGSGSW